ncbi:uncharacterized protein LOC142563409 [Dermacentor variabilis]|uniref:uncharacterized protein LOC142563409 n=1 Tax=Dermacentor variabilis TaxID=34621 RepID=UPI003F5B3F62
MTRKRMAVPHTEFDCPPSLLVKSAVDPKLARQVTKEKLQLSKSTKQREILQKKRKRGSSHFSESDDEVVEKGLLKKEQRKTKQLEEKNRVLFERLKKEKKKNEELQALLTTKFDLLLTHLNDARPKLACVDSGMDFDYSNNDYIFLDVRPAAPAAASRDSTEVICMFSWSEMLWCTVHVCINRKCLSGLWMNADVPLRHAVAILMTSLLAHSRM